MEQKKHLPLRIVNSFLLLASLGICVIAMIKNPADTSSLGTNPLTIICEVLNIIMLAFGIVYMLMNYSKSAVIIYKVFFGALFIEAFVQTLYLASKSTPVYEIALNLIPVAVVAVLATAKDLGKKNTELLTIVVILCRLVMLSIYIINSPHYGTATFGIISAGISDFLIALTTGVMVIGKYLDKAERETK